MSSERINSINDDGEQSSDGMDTKLASLNVRPRVTAKKTFFDLHRHNGSKNADKSGSDVEFHPKPQWSAGSTEVGIGSQQGHVKQHSTRDIMKPSLSLNLEASTIDLVTTLPTLRNNLPPIPNTWGATDAVPTQPEEIQHLTAPSPLVEGVQLPKTSITEPKKKFFNKFHKRSIQTSYVLDNSQPSRIPVSTENLELFKPEIEFKRLNESYVRAGLIPNEILAEDQNPDSTSATKKTSGHQVNKTKLKPTYHIRRSNEKKLSIPSITIDFEPRITSQNIKDTEPKESTRSSLQNKNLTIDANTTEHSNSMNLESTNLPARRSCEPLDVKNLRKLWEPNSPPGPSRIGQQNSEIRTTTKNDIANTVFASTKSELKSLNTPGEIDEMEIVDPSFEENSMTKIEGNTLSNDCFKIENPFSDFSLQTVNLNKHFSRRNGIESGIENNEWDPSQPSTSKGSPSVKIAFEKVSLRNSNSNSNSQEKKIRQHSVVESAVDGMKQTSFLDKAVMDNYSQNNLPVIATPLDRRKTAEPMRAPGGLNQQLNMVLFCDVIGHITDENNNSSISKLTHNAFDYYNSLQTLLTPLMRTLLTPLNQIAICTIFNNLGTDFLPTFTSKSPVRIFVFSLVIAENSIQTDRFFHNSYPKAIDNFINVSAIWNINRYSVDESVMSTVCGLSDLLEKCGDKKIMYLPLAFELNAQTVYGESDELFDIIVQEVLQSVINQTLFRELRFLSPISALMLNNRVFEDLDKVLGIDLRFDNYPYYFLNSISAPIVTFFESLFNFHGTRELKIFESFPGGNNL